MIKNKIVPINIWNNIERVHVQRLDIVFEGRTIVGIHHSDMDNAIVEIDTLCKKLQQYKKELQLIYNSPKSIKHRSMIGTHVYLIKCKATGRYKIGRSVNPDLREKTLLSQSPDLEIVFISPLTKIKSEKELHATFKEKRIRGEWFSLCQSDIEYIKHKQYGIA